MTNSVNFSHDSLQIPTRGDADQELVVDVFIDLKFGMGLEIFPYCRLGVIALAPRAVRRATLCSIFDYRIEHNALATDCSERSVGL